MVDLFVRPDGSPMQFHLADLNQEIETKYTLLIEDSGGIVETIANEEVLTFTVPAQSFKYDFVFNVQFIDDCIAYKTILNVNKYYSTMKYEHICKAIQNKMSMRYVTLKSTESKDKQVKKPKTVPLKKNTTQELNIEKTKKLKQTTLKKSVLDKNKNQQCVSDAIDDSDSETEIAPSPVLNRTCATINPRRKVVHREIAELSRPSTLKDKSDPEYTVILSSDDDADKNEPQKNLMKVERNSKEVDKGGKAEGENKKCTEVENQDDSEKTADAQKESLSIELQKFIEDIRKNKIMDKYDHPESSTEKFVEWETQAILRYLIIADRIDEAKSRSVWQDVQRLKILPRKKGAQLMLNHFKRVILPNIESYNLRPEVLAKFQALGPPKKVIEDS